MARNGSGTYSLPAGNPVVTGTVISSTTQNNTMTDVATALTQSLAYDGQTVPVANLPMGTYRHTGVGAGVALTDYARYDQVQNSTATYLTSPAGTNTITAAAAPTPAAYAAGQKFWFIPANTNTGATTLNVSSLGAKNVFIAGAACVGGEIRASVPVVVVYDGTQFNIVGNSSFVTASQYQSALPITALAAGTADARTATLSPAIAAYTDKMIVGLRIPAASTSASPTLNLNSVGAKTVVKGNNIVLDTGDLLGDQLFQWNTTLDKWVVLNPVNGVYPAVGHNQTMQDVSASRAAGVQYTNSTVRPISVYISAYSNVNSAVYLSANGSSNQQVRNDGVLAGVPVPFYLEVLPGDTYILTNSAGTLTIAKWWEAR